jgi:predicted AlkP superfamily phosphohydrolase/phosphomutase
METRRFKITVAIASLLTLVGAAALMTACGTTTATPGKRVIVLGFDGMDYDLTKRLMAEGRMPHFSRLAREGTFGPLGTSIPPQSPVAWSSFITGKDPGGHGIFDFVHRDPATMIPYLSTTRTEQGDPMIEFGKWQIPGSGTTELLRKGQAFWEVLENQGISTTVMRIPANFPPSGTASYELSGMGTPDLTGSYGTFLFYTADRRPFAGKKISGGKVIEAAVRDNTFVGRLYGPDNPFLVEPEKVKKEFTVFLDPDRTAAKIVIGDDDGELILEQGEWSDWTAVEFDLIPTQTMRGMCRFYLKEVRPVFQLYITPINFDPHSPEAPISTPISFAAELAEANGSFYTQGMPEDTKALTGGVFSRREFLDQAAITGDEIIKQYHWVLDRFEGGLLFYYFGNLDQISHMLWRPMDPDHPAYDPESDPEFADVIPAIYEQMDAVVGYTLDRIDDDTTLVVMSDHGFTSWRRAFHLNTWLLENGYLALKSGAKRDASGFFSGVDWSRTRAYGLGINGLYINLRGRERNGIVAHAERQALISEIAEKLLATVDDVTGTPAVTKVYDREKIYKNHENIELAPDLLVGYAKGVRGSNESALGGLTEKVLTDNADEWSGDHCMDHEAVPGILLTNRPLTRSATALDNLAAAILGEFGVEEFPTDG